MLTAGSLLTRIGVMDEGFLLAVVKVVWHSEVEPYCIKLLQRRYPGVPNYGNIREEFNPPFTDILFGGFPCQPVSEQGSGRFFNDYRWLWPRMLYYVRKQQPRWVVIENVPGLRTSGVALQQVLRDLAESGYDAEWNSIPANAVGAPHRRERIFIVAYPAIGSNDSDPTVFKNGQSKPETFYKTCSFRSWWVHRYSGGKLETRASELKTGYGWWRFEPRLPRLVYGIPDRVERCKALGEAVVPQVAEWLARQIVHVERERYAVL